MTPPIWLIGGTHESAQLAEAIAHTGWTCLITVTTDAAKHLYPRVPNVTVWVGLLDEIGIREFIIQHQIGIILDASHPFAVDISKLAIAAATAHHIPYLRYERPDVAKSGSRSRQQHLFKEFDDVVESNVLIGHRALLTIGYRPLPQFREWHDRATLFTRILPSPKALSVALDSGFTPDRIIAIRPPLSADFERALWHHWRITLVVTKASGNAGGEPLKQQIADELGIPLVTIARPSVRYPRQTQCLNEAIAFCHDQANAQNA
ncbi:MAG: cobalt-precorrin-6A reductase [Elainellaceae cyanobacterium]